MSNIFGKIFQLSSYGESHGHSIGGIIDGCPSGIEISIEEIQNELNRRRPGNSKYTTKRQETDKVEILSGIYEGKSTGMPIGFQIKNTGHKSSDYDSLKDIYRPSHADYTWHKKYGIRDYRGGGRASAREHIARIVGGAIAKQVLKECGVSILAFTSSIGSVEIEKRYFQEDFIEPDSEFYCPDYRCIPLFKEVLEKAISDKDTLGGSVGCRIINLPVGVGEPVFDKLQSLLAYSMMSINAAKYFEYGLGYDATKMSGSIHNDEFVLKNGNINTKTNNSGGIQGGISNGETVFFRVGFKPISSIGKIQNTIDKNGNNVSIQIEGRHDPCVIPRVVPVVEAMCAMTTLDMILQANIKM